MISASQLSRSSVWISFPLSPRGPTDGCHSCKRSTTPSREMYVELMIFRIGCQIRSTDSASELLGRLVLDHRGALTIVMSIVSMRTAPTITSAASQRRVYGTPPLAETAFERVA